MQTVAYDYFVYYYYLLHAGFVYYLFIRGIGGGGLPRWFRYLFIDQGELGDSIVAGNILALLYEISCGV